HVTELVCFVVFLFRLRHNALLSPDNASVLVAFPLSVLVLLMRPLLPGRQWARLVLAYRLPRYLCSMTAKGLIAFGGFPAPPGLQSHLLGVGLLLTEGLLLPASALLPPITAAVVHSVLQCLTGCMLLRLGASQATALAVGLRAALAGTLTSVVCHTFMRARFAHRQCNTAQQQTVPLGGAAKTKQE
ncbi:hypothetical protein TSOC_008422, partial [Tetrabaena socialis]